jgi:hypothetical protein
MDDGAGPDVFKAFAGRDGAQVGNGSDRIQLGAGPDNAGLSDDDRKDVIRCGDGNDMVEYFGPIDPLDRLRGCETVSVIDGD